MSGIGGQHPARVLLSVECQGIGAEIGTPERRLEALLQRVGAGFEVERHRRLYKMLGKPGRREPGRVHIALHLTEGDRPHCEAPVGVRDRILAILPTLIQEPLRRLAAVFDKAVAVAITEALDPAQRG